MLAADQQALVQRLSNTNAAGGEIQAGAGAEPSALRWIPAVGQMMLGFILPFALTFVAIPLESFVHAARTVLGVLAIALLRAVATVLRIGASFSRSLARGLVAAYDLLIFLPLAGERLARQAARRPDSPERPAGGQ